MTWWGWAHLAWAVIASLGVLVLSMSLMQRIEALHELTATYDVLPGRSDQDNAATVPTGLQRMPA